MSELSDVTTPSEREVHEIVNKAVAPLLRRIEELEQNQDVLKKRHKQLLDLLEIFIKINIKVEDAIIDIWK